MGAVESVKAASDIFAPVSGQIEAVNGELADQPDLLNKDAEGAGASPFFPRARKDFFPLRRPCLLRSCPLSAYTDSLRTTGWLAKIKLSNPGEFDQLLNGEAYKAHCEGESEASD